MKPTLSRRRVVVAAAAALTLLTTGARAQSEDIVLGGSIPLIGVFAFGAVLLRAV